jgi:hypothetical protein
VTLIELIELLDRTPVIAKIHPVSLCYLPKDVTVFETLDDLVKILDDPNITLPQRFLVASDVRPYASRFPYVYCEHEPLSPALNEIIFNRFDDLCNSLLEQSQVSDRIIEDAHVADLIILLLVDGLSYEDLRGWDKLKKSNWNIEPCLVDVPTITRLAFPNLIGRPTIAERLFHQGFHHRIGFTYWDRDDNELTDQLFNAIIDVNKVTHFEDILTMLRKALENFKENKYYVQIIRTGLDGYSHSQKRKAPLASVMEELKGEFTDLTNLVGEVCEKFDIQASIYLTSDHGILWLDEFEPLVVGSAPARSSARWCNWRNLYNQNETGRMFLVDGEEFYCLGFPKLRRPHRIDEQGVHGGISYQESVVPFLRVKVKASC